MMNSRALVLFAVLFGALLSAFPSASASAATDDSGDGRTTWSIQPAAVGGPDGRVSLRHTIEPGDEAVDYVTISNLSGRAAAFDVYPSDGIVTGEGQFDLLSAGTAPTDSGSWIAVGDPTDTAAETGAVHRVEIDADSAVTLPVTVRVPADATPGDHPAGLVASLVQEDAGEVMFDTRVGVRLHLRVAGDLAPELTVRDVATAYSPSWNPFAPGTLRVDYVVANSGNVRLGADIRADGSGPFGMVPYAGLGAGVREVLPGQGTTGSVEIDVWPTGLLNGTVSVTPLVVGEDDVSAEIDVATAAHTTWAVPWAQALLLAALVAVVLLMRSIHRRRERQVEARIEAAVAGRLSGAENGV